MKRWRKWRKRRKGGGSGEEEDCEREGGFGRFIKGETFF